MTRLEGWQNSEQNAPGRLNGADLSRSVQNFFQPITVDLNCREDLPLGLNMGSVADLYQSAAYTGGRLSASVFMTDEVEQKLDATKIQQPSDKLTPPTSIRTKEDEAIWEAMQQPHKLGKHESATHIGLSLEVIAEMQKNGQGSKLELFDSAAEGALAALQKPQTEQVLIASNIAPNVPNIEQKQQYQDVQSDSERPKVAQYGDGYMPSPTLVPSPEQLGFTKENTVAIIQAAGKLLGSLSDSQPIRGIESQLMQRALSENPNAWEHAGSSFKQLEGLPVGLMKAYIRNELAFYNQDDWRDDLAALAGHPRSDTATLGMSQISIKGVREFEERYPQFKQFLEGKGYSGPAGHEARALLDPTCVPMIVAAKTASVVDDLEKHHVSVTPETVAYAYNPDVYSYPDGHGKQEYKALYQGEVLASKAQHWDQKKEYYANNPDVIAASKHIKNVLQCMQEL